MNWEVVASMGDLIGGIATFFGLILVFYELRNLRRNQYASTAQGIVDSERDLWNIILQDKQMTKLMSVHLGLSDELLEKYGLNSKSGMELLMFFRQYENLYYQNQHGMLPPDLWEHWYDSMVHTFSNPAIQEILINSKTSYTRGFREFIQNEIVPKTTGIGDSN